MKHKIVLTIFGLAFLAFIFTSSSGGRANAANSGNTGAPGESTTCVTCHNTGGSYNPSLSIQVFSPGTTTPVTAYTPGVTYDMEVMISSVGSPAGFGFQMLALNGSNANAGTWSNPSSNTQISSVGSKSYVEHGVGFTYSTSNTFTMKWTAPTTGTGNVTFYSSGNAVNGNGGTGGDAGTTNTLMINEAASNVSADMASNLGIMDIGNGGNGSDIQVTFDAATNESTIGQYRILIVKQANAASFNLASANAVSAGLYTIAFPNGSSTYTKTLSPLAKDVDGATITNGQSYVAFVLSVADGTNANINALSFASSSVLVQGVAGTATGLMTSDAGNTGAPDLNVQFNKATNESTVSEYRVMLVENSNVSSFDLAAAQSVMMSNYNAVTPNGSNNYTSSFGMSSTDVNGNALTNGTTYAAFVLSIADGTLAVANTLSSASNALLLQTVAGVATNVMALDTNDAGTGEDLLVYFDAATDETTISEYRILVVKSSNATGFDEAAASAVTMSNYTAVSPNGTSAYSTTLTNIATDVDGDAIITNVPYQAFVLSVADGTIAGTSTLSTPSADITLNDPVSTNGRFKLEGNLTMVGEQLHLLIDSKFIGSQMTIFDANGRLIVQQKITQNEHWINMNAYAKGVYWVNIRTENQTWTGSILK